MTPVNDVVQLTQDLVAIPSASQISNVPVSDYLQQWLDDSGFEIERYSYRDGYGEKVILVAMKGEGSGGMAFCSHSDTVPGQEEDWDPYDPVIRDGLMYGRGSCDMKGPLAATMIAAASVDPAKLKKPIYIVVTSDEELGLTGAKYLAEVSGNILDRLRPEYGIIAEPTSMSPVYSHKGYGRIFVTARGRAAHSSTGKGVSANFLIAPFLADMAEMARTFLTDESFMNHDFDPPSNGFNMVISDGECPINVTAPKSTCHLSFRAMPDSRVEDVIEMVSEKARSYDLEVEAVSSGPLYVAPDSELVKSALAATGNSKPTTVPYGTDGIYLQSMISQMVVLGPGDIGVAHTVGEYVPVAELNQAVDVYKTLIQQFCM